MKYGKHLSVQNNELMIFPVQTMHHWSALVFQPYSSGLYAVDSGRTKLFAHTDLQYAPYIATLEDIMKVDRGTFTRNPFRLPVAIQPNGHDCGYHVILNSRSLADFVLGFESPGDDEISLEKWPCPTSTPPEIKLFRENFAAEVAALPECDSDVDSDDEPLAVAAGHSGCFLPPPPPPS